MKGEKNCFFCGGEITIQNKSKEHIIPNALGGRKTISDFICRSCNSGAGTLWDAELAKQINPVTLLMGIIRQRGEAPSLIVDTLMGEKYRLTHKGKLEVAHPVIKESKAEDGKTQIYILASTRKEIQAIIKSLERKYPHINEVATQDKFEEKDFYAEGPMSIPLSIGGKVAGKSIVKSCLALAHSTALENVDYSNVRKYFSDEITPYGVWTYCCNDYVENRNDFEMFHCVHIEGIPEEKILVGYVEYYATFKFIVLLSDNYTKECIHATYALNPLTGSTVDVKLSLGITRKAINQILYDDYDIDEIKNSMEKLLRFCQKKSWEEEKNRVVDEAVVNGFKKTGLAEGEYFTDKHVQAMTDGIMEKLAPFLFRQNRRRPLNNGNWRGDEWRKALAEEKDK